VPARNESHWLGLHIKNPERIDSGSVQYSSMHKTCDIIQMAITDIRDTYNIKQQNILL